MRAVIVGLGLVCGLVLGAVEADAAEFTCPRDSGAFAHPRDGTKYFECIKGVANPRSCTPGMVWDDLRKGCTSAGSVRRAPPKKPGSKHKKRK